MQMLARCCCLVSWAFLFCVADWPQSLWQKKATTPSLWDLQVESSWREDIHGHKVIERSDKSWYLDVYGPALQVDNPKLSLCKREKIQNPHVLVVMLQGNFFLVFSQSWSWLSDSKCGVEAEPDFPSTWSMMISNASLDSIRLYPGLAYTRPGIIPTIVCCIFFTLVDEMLASISMTLSPFSCTCCRRKINWTHGTERILEDQRNPRCRFPSVQKEL